MASRSSESAIHFHLLISTVIIREQIGKSEHISALCSNIKNDEKTERKRVQPPALLCELYDKLRWWVPIAVLEPAVLQHLELLRVLIRVALAPAGYPPQRQRRLRVLSTWRAIFNFLATGAKLPQLPLSFILSGLSLFPSPPVAHMVVPSHYPLRIRRCCRFVWTTVSICVHTPRDSGGKK